MTETAVLPSVSATRTHYRPTPRRIVGALWLTALLCYLYCDVLGFYDGGLLRQVLAGRVDGMSITPTFLLGAAGLMTIPTAMVLLVRVASHRVARWGTVVGGTVMTLVQLASVLVGGVAPYYAYFSVLEVGITSFLVVYAARSWREEDARDITG